MKSCRNNEGYTLVELVIAMMVTAIVITMVISFMSDNSRSYDYVRVNLKLQEEAQSVLNQLSDIIIEADWMKAEDVDSNRKAFLIYQGGEVDVILFDRVAKQLYLIGNLTESAVADITSITYTVEDNLMADGISAFSFNPEDAQALMDEKRVCLCVDFADNNQTYHVERNVTFRNRLVEH